MALWQAIAGYDQDVLLAAEPAMKDLNLIVGAHTHTFLYGNKEYPSPPQLLVSQLHEPLPKLFGSVYCHMYYNLKSKTTKNYNRPMRRRWNPDPLCGCRPNDKRETCC